MRIFGFATALCIIVVLLSSCATNYHDPAVLFHKKGLILIENEDYKRTNDALLLLLKKYDCTIKNSFRASSEDGQTVSAEYTLSVSDNLFDEFVNEIRFSFKNEIGEERISQVSINEISSKSKIIRQRDLEYEVRYLTRLYEDETNATIKQIRAAELERKNSELATTISDIETDINSLDRSTVNIIWKQKKTNDCKREPSCGPTGAMDKCPHSGAPPMHRGMEMPPKLSIEVNTIGNVENIKNEDDGIIDLSGVDLNREKVVSTPAEDGYALSVEENPNQEESVIFLTNKCQIVHVGMGPIPSIITTGNAANEQVIVTPWIDEDCNQIGFEIRAGSVESGCKNGLGNLRRLKSCNKHQKLKAVPSETKKVKKATKRAKVTPEVQEPAKRKSMSDEWKSYKWQPDTDDR